MQSIIKKLEDKKIFDDWSISIDEYGELLDEIIDNQKKQSLEEKKTQLVVIMFFKLENFEKTNRRNPIYEVRSL